MAKQLVLLYPPPVRALRTLLSYSGAEGHYSGLWVVESGAATLFTVDLDWASLTVWPEEHPDAPAHISAGPVTVPLYGLFAVAGEPLYARVEVDREGVLTGVWDEDVRTIRPCVRLHRLGLRPGPAARWRVARAASRLPPPWRLAPAQRDGG